MGRISYYGLIDTVNSDIDLSVYMMMVSIVYTSIIQTPRE